MKFYPAAFSVKRLGILAVIIGCLLFSTTLRAEESKTPEISAPEKWTVIPAGAKPAYVGIHGGTMPVSLLASGDGSSLFSFVGRTGNDFLNALKDVFQPMPSLGNSTYSKSYRLFPAVNPDLFAGNSSASLPVLSLSSEIQTRSPAFNHLTPFGLSDRPLSIEGETAKPAAITKARQYRQIFLPDYFLPKRPNLSRSGPPR